MPIWIQKNNLKLKIIEALPLLFIILLVTLMYLSRSTSLDPDFGWHLRLGEWMVANHKLVSSFVGYNNIFGSLYTIDHQWLSDVLLYKIYSLFGYWALILINYTVFVLLFAIINGHLARRNVAPFKRAFFMSLLLLTMTSMVGGVRLQYLLLLFIAIIILIKDRVDNFFSRLMLYFLLFVIGANLHGGGMFILVAIPIFIEADALGFRRAGIKALIKTQALKLILLTAVLCLALTLTPYGFGLYKFVWQYYSVSYYQKHIAEWFPVNGFPFGWLNIFLPLAIYFFILLAGQYWKNIQPNRLLLMLLFLYLSLKARRTLPVFALIFTFYGHGFPPSTGFKLPKYIIRGCFVLTCIIFIGLFVLNIASFKLKVTGAPFDDPSYPSGAAKFIAENKLYAGNMQNPYSWGGYLVWTDKNLQLTIDGRNPIVLYEDRKCILEEYGRFYSESPQEISDMLKKDNIQYVLIEKPQEVYLTWPDRLVLNGDGKNRDMEKLMHPTNNLYNYLSTSDSQWTELYQDDISVIYTKKTEAE